MAKIGVVVVTYNRLKCLKKNLDCLIRLDIRLDDVVNIVVVNNNSTDGTTDYLENFGKLKNKSINVLNLRENLGGSGGFYTGVKWCLDNDMDYIWGMDDDAYPEKNSLVNLMNVVNKYGDDNCYWSNCNNDNSFDNEVKSVQTWMFVGFFINIKIVKKIGLPKADYFIYHDDSEYAYRIINSGYKILKCRDSLIEHKDGISTYYSGKKILNKEIKKYSVLPDWKRYYDVRNMLLMYSVRDKNFWKTLFIFCPKTLVSAVLYNPKQVRIIRKAILHGVTRKSGTYIRPS